MDYMIPYSISLFKSPTAIWPLSILTTNYIFMEIRGLGLGHVHCTSWTNFQKNSTILNNLKNNINPPSSDISFKKSRLKVLYSDIDRIITDKHKNSKENLVKLFRLMNSNSLASNLKKGYSILTIDNKIIKNSNSIKAKDNVTAKLNKGTLNLIVKKIN